MAIDTRERRASTASFNLTNYGHGVTPQATFPQSKRQSVVWSYAGINADSLVTVESYSISI